MDEEKYRTLCNACDEILSDLGGSAAILAISYLHIIREHPGFLEKYENLFDPELPAQAPRSALKNLAGLARVLFHAGPCQVERDSPRRADVLFVSHLVNAAQLTDPEDFYFYDLPQQCEGQGISCAVALIDHVREPFVGFRNGFLRGGVRTTLLRSHLGMSAALRDIVHLKAARAQIRLAAKKESRTLNRHVLDSAALACVTPETLWNLGLGAQIAKLANKLRPRFLVMTYEGHAWEKVACRMARIANPKLKCIGYQHSSLFRMQHAIRRNLGRGCDPDIIMTAGSMAKNILDLEPRLQRTPVRVLGSRRGRGQSPTPDMGGSSQKVAEFRSGCLVIPEGTEPECRMLFEFSLRCAAILPGVNFIWRVHPVISGSGFLTRDRLFHNLPKNVTLSRLSLEEDIASCQAVLYRGSTAVVKAAAAGLVPIYVGRAQEMSIDPLFTLGGYRMIACSPPEVAEALDRPHLTQEKTSRYCDAELQEILGTFYEPLRPEALISFFQEGCGAAGHRGS